MWFYRQGPERTWRRRQLQPRLNPHLARIEAGHASLLQSAAVCSIMAAMMLPEQAKPVDSYVGQDGQAARIERMALRLEAAGLSAPAIAFLEVNRPLAFLGSQMLLVAQPLLSPFLPSLDGWIEILEDRGSVERLVRRLEQGPQGASPLG
jgi:hypothetical protein